MADNRLPHKERLRKKIQTAMVADRLIKAFNGEIELTQTQANIGLRLLNKMLPDLKAVELDGEVGVEHSVDVQSVEQAAKNVLEILNATRD